MHYLLIGCPKCRSHSIKKNGKTSNKKQRYRCLRCFRQFITNYTYQGCRQDIRSLILPMTMNGSGVRDISRVLSISPQTVSKSLRHQADLLPKQALPERLADLELDEMWAFVGSKANEQWLWYGFDAKSRRVLGWLSAPHTKQSCKEFLSAFKGCKVLRFSTDKLKAYEEMIKAEHHWVGKEWTQRIERNHLNFRTHIKRLQRRTICFSKSEQMHEAVIKLYVHHLNSRQHLL